MQGLHHQQQQLAALLSVALPKDDSSPSEEDDSNRLAALNSLQRAILYPPNSLLVAHSSSFLSQGLSQLLSDKSFSVRQLAAICYGSLCSVVCSSTLASNGRQNHVITGAVVDRFISWALPLIRDVTVGNGAAELALAGLLEFLNVGDASRIEGYILPILKACQELLEDERTSLNLLHQLLGILTLISVKFGQCFLPHFVDIIDLLLGWALVPDLSESDRSPIMDSFLQFQKHWLSNLQFSLGLLSKFLGDMEVLVQDGSVGTPQQFRRFLALLSCFLTVLQVTASGMLEMNLLEQISEPLIRMLPQLLACLSTVGKKFGWSKWAKESWRCLILLAEILCEKFSSFYPMAVEMLFHSLCEDSSTSGHGFGKIPSFQVQGVLKTNMQLLSFQKISLLPSSVQKILQFDSPLSQLRLHPNHLVVGSSAATYFFLLQHECTGVVMQAVISLTEELELLKSMLEKIRRCQNEVDGKCNLDLGSGKCYSDFELLALFKFDLKILLSCVCSRTDGSLLDQMDVATSHNERSLMLASFIIEKLNPFESPIQGDSELQVHVLRTLHKLSDVEFSTKCVITKNSQKTNALDVGCGHPHQHQATSILVIVYLRKYSDYIVRALHASPLAVKLEGLEWVHSFCESVIAMNMDVSLSLYYIEEHKYASISSSLLLSLLNAALDRESKVRSTVAPVLELLLRARLIHPGHFYSVTMVVLEKLGDPDTSIKNAFVRLLSVAVPITVYAFGAFEDEIGFPCGDVSIGFGNRAYMQWRQAFALKQQPRQFHSQQLVSVLSYISQRWKVPLSPWIQRLVFSCRCKKDFVSGHQEETGNVNVGANGLWMDVNVVEAMLDKVCPVNNVAAAWWAIHEASRHCVNVRLRTNLGGPTQTFAALERMLLDIAHVLQLDTEQNEGNLNLGAARVHLLPMRLLLDFVEALKKNVYNAYEGSCVLTCAPRQSSLFFRANKKVCEEWFARICEPMMNAGLAMQCHAATVHYCAIRLQDLRNLVASALKDKPRAQVAEYLHNVRARFQGDVLQVLRHMALALCRSREPESLVGLQKWVIVTFSSLFVEDNQLITGHTGGSLAFSWITGLVYQAHGQYEKAAAHFCHLLQSEDALNSMGSEGVQFAIARVIESYTALSDWKSLETWLLELQALRAKHAGKSYSGALTTAGNEINAIHALARFDEGDVDAAWGFLDLTPKSSSELTLDPKLAFQRSEQMLLQAMLRRGFGKLDKVPEEIEKAKLMLEEPLSVLPLDGLTEAAAYATQLHCIFAFEDNYKNNGQHEPNQLSAIVSSLHQVLQHPIIKVHQDCNLWMKVLRVYRTLLPASLLTLKLFQKLIGLARKQRNFMMAHRLSLFLRTHLAEFDEGKYTELFLRNLQYESILLAYAEDKHEDALTCLWSLVHSYMMSPSLTDSDSDGILEAKTCLKLSTWLSQKHPYKNLENVLYKMHADFADFRSLDATSLNRSEISASDLNYNLILEEVVGTATKLSTQFCPVMCKSWLSYASWCYSQARGSISAPNTVLQSCSMSPILHPEVLSDRFQLKAEEVARVEAIIIKLFHSNVDVRSVSDVGEEQIIWPGSEEYLKTETSLKALVQQTVYLIQEAAALPGVEDCNGDCPSAVLTSQLRTSFLHANMGTEKTDIESSVSELVNIWWSLRQRRVSLFGHAAHGYLQFLTHASSKLQDNHSASSDLDYVRQKAENCTLRATLYILHILLNYGVELRDILEPGLATTPLLPWQEITPQLFARLSSHPEHVVRKQLEALLMMLAKLSPWSIVYPTMVDVNACEGEPSEELQHIMGCLGKLYPKLIQDVQLVINELGAVTVLWEEQWLSTLQDLHTDVIRRINMLKEEVARIAENVTLSQSEKNKINAAKYSAMMAPIVVALERRLASTSRKPETVHEVWFHKEYGEQLKSAILAFKTPPLSAAALGDVWRPFDAIAASLAAHQRKSLISLSDVAPQLALLSSSDVPMPGLEKQISISDSTAGTSSDLQGIVTISSFSEQVTILSTKTKPKKLVILGSDGQKYTFLLKGREDLRLDARIMQLLQAVNGFLRSHADTHSRSIAVRYYSVTPISGRAGLIQWVDNVISIYSVFKSWQNRVQLAQLSAVGTGNMHNTVPPIPRPSDMFYGKIIPALKEKGIRRVISRRDWPHEVKRKVLVELMKETPSQLLHQEIWCASEGFKAFSSKLKRYSGSVAAMSMVGHVLGLGDRHLDNILMDFQSGDVVHIDYNVCFDKGQRLKIPEIVPFRLTQTIEAALGLTGVEGAFRANCEAVVGVLRKNKDILLMLLEVFVWDPLVEWTRGDGHDEAAIGGEERKGMELAVSLSLFASRVQEIRVPLQEHHDLLLATLPAAESALEKFLDVLNQYDVVSALFYHVDQERSNLLRHETSAKSIVAEATSNSEKTRASFEVQAREFAQAKAAATEKAQEAAMWIEQHGRVIDALRSGSILEVQSCLKLSMMEDLSLTSAVLVAGVPLTIVPEPTQAQCHDLDREVSQVVAELDSGLSCALQALQTYTLALQRVLPLNYITTSPVHVWAQILQLSVNSLSSETLAVARRQAAELIAKAQGEGLDSIRQRHEDLGHQVQAHAINIEKVKEECSELVNSIGADTEAKSKDLLLSAFTKYMQSAGYLRREGDGAKDIKLQGETGEKKAKVLSVIHVAASALYNEVKIKVLDILSNSTGRIGQAPGEDCSLQNSIISFGEFEEQIEKCVLVTSFVNEIQQLIGMEIPRITSDSKNIKYSYGGNWASVFHAIILSCRILIGQMIEVVLPEILSSVVSCNSEIMDTFGSLSQIRGSIDTALEQLVEVHLERASLAELEQNYFVKVGLITEQQLALEEAALKGRDHLSWEEAEELATQEEACRAQLDQLHQTWNQKDKLTSSLIKKEANLKNVLISAERQFLSLVSIEQGADPQSTRSKALLATLARPFSELESIDQALLPSGSYGSYTSGPTFNIADFMTSGFSLSESVWKYAGLLSNHAFFIWKVATIDSFLDSCIHGMSSSVDLNLGFDQLYNILKKKLEMQLKKHVDQYLSEWVAPALLMRLESESEHLKKLTEPTKDFTSDQLKRDVGAVKKVQRALEEYCNAHETARAAKSAVSLLERQVGDLTESLNKAIFEIVQMEWLHDVSLPYIHKNHAISQNFLSDDKLSPIILNLNRPKLLESIQSSMSSIAGSLERLQACERTSLSAEGQLERAMGWACAGTSSTGTGTTSVKNSGIPSEFHDHLMKRGQLLRATREQASDILKFCASIMEFEASRDGLFRMPGDVSAGRTTGDGRSWQQTYLSALTRLDVTYHSFTRAEQEWKVAQSSMEAAANALFSATNELCIASVKAKSASGDLQGTLGAMRDLAYEASVALSAFSRVSRGHTALTLECGSMLEEVLAITEGLHDVYTLGKEAATVHASLMENLSKVNMILLPLESMLSKDVAALADSIARERESKMEISPIHGQALYQSYFLRLEEVCHSLRPLVPLVTNSVEELHAMLTRLARTASIHAGNLHKALEGLGESQVVQSQEIGLSRPELGDDAILFDENSPFSDGDRQGVSGLVGSDEFALRDEGWISPPDSIYTSSSGSCNTSSEVSQSDNSDSQANAAEQLSDGGNAEGAAGNSDSGQLADTVAQEISIAGRLKSQCAVDRMGSDISDSSKQDPSEQLQALSISNEGAINHADSRHHIEKEIIEGVTSLDGRSEASISIDAKGNGGNHDDPSYVDPVNRVARGKNPYALSVLRRVEMKLDGKDIEENRQMSVSEQVDHLLKQATSIDNLCNMYEGWTPWI